MPLWVGCGWPGEGGRGTHLDFLHALHALGNIAGQNALLTSVASTDCSFTRKSCLRANDTDAKQCLNKQNLRVLRRPAIRHSYLIATLFLFN